MVFGDVMLEGENVKNFTGACLKEITLKTELPELPKELEWVKILLKIKSKNPTVKFLFCYGGEVLERPKFVFDPENGMSPLMPDEVKVFNIVTEGVNKKYKLVNTIDFRRNPIDPDVDTALTLWDVCNSF